MNKIVMLAAFAVSVFSVHSQNNGGVRGTAEFSGNKKIKPIPGAGIYVNICDFSEKIEVLLFTDFYYWKKGFSSAYASVIIGANGFYVFPMAKNIKTKAGPLFNYRLMESDDEGFYGTNTSRAKCIGAGITGNFEMQNIFKLPVNFDIFISPAYFFKIKTEYNGFGNDDSKNFASLSLQLGLSYVIK